MLRSFVGLAAASLAAALALAPAPASAYTPESGIWWNPNESGTGVVIEVQDNLMVVAAYVGDAQGKATWYTATAFLDGNAFFEGSLDLTQGSQCMGCPYPGIPTVTPGAGGDVTIVFDPEDETKAALTWDNGRTIPIERFEYYTRRPEDGATPIDITKMLGEWQWTMDVSSDPDQQFPYYGDVTVFDVFEFDNGEDTWFYEGCRADNSIDGGCSNNALALHSAAGYYVPSLDAQCIVVDDSNNTYLLYAVKAGTNHVRGEATLYVKGQNPRNYFQYPVRGFRSASRTFVQEGVGPSKAATARKGLGDVMQPRTHAAGKVVEFGDYTDACLDDAPALKRAETLLVAKRKG